MQKKNVAQYHTLLNKVHQWIKQNISQTLKSQKTPHVWHFCVSSEMSVVNILKDKRCYKSQTLNFQMAPHTSSIWVSVGCLLWELWRKEQFYCSKVKLCMYYLYVLCYEMFDFVRQVVAIHLHWHISLSKIKTIISSLYDLVLLPFWENIVIVSKCTYICLHDV